MKAAQFKALLDSLGTIVRIKSRTATIEPGDGT